MLVGTLLALAVTSHEGDIKYECSRAEHGAAFANLPPPSGYHLLSGGAFDSHLSQVTVDGPLEALHGWQMSDEIACVAYLTADSCPGLEARETARQLAQMMVHGSGQPCAFRHREQLPSWTRVIGCFHFPTQVAYASNITTTLDFFPTKTLAINW